MRVENHVVMNLVCTCATDCQLHLNLCLKISRSSLTVSNSITLAYNLEHPGYQFIALAYFF